MPLRSCARTDEPTSANAIKASKTMRILVSRKSMLCLARPKKTLLAQEPVEVSRLVEVLGGIEPNRIDQSRRGEVCAIEIGAIDYDAGEDRAAQGSPPQRRIGEIRIPERCQFTIQAGQIRLEQERSLEIAV